MVSRLFAATKMGMGHRPCRQAWYPSVCQWPLCSGTATSVCSWLEDHPGPGRCATRHCFAHLHLDLVGWGIKNQCPCSCPPVTRPQLVSVSSPDVASLPEQLLREKKEDTFTQLEDNKKLSYYQSILFWDQRKNYIIGMYKYILW